MKQAKDDCILLAVRGCGAAQEALCLMLEWRLLPNEEARLQIVNALESTPSGKTRYAALCQRQRNLQELVRSIHFTNNIVQISSYHFLLIINYFIISIHPVL